MTSEQSRVDIFALCYYGLVMSLLRPTRDKGAADRGRSRKGEKSVVTDASFCNGLSFSSLFSQFAWVACLFLSLNCLPPVPLGGCRMVRGFR